MNTIVKYLSRSSAIIAFFILFSGSRALYPGIKVYPRLFTPGTILTNENVFFEFGDFSDPKPVLTIFDLSGRTVRTIQVINPTAIATGWRLAWDGKDDGGNMVFPGVYIYQWREAASATTGTIVVAR